VNDDATALNGDRQDADGTTAGPVLPDTVRVLADDPDVNRLDLVEGGGSAWAVAWPGVGSHLRSIHRFSLGAGAATRRQCHPMEAVYYVLSGEATVEDLDTAEATALVPGSMAFVEPRTSYRFVAAGTGAELVGGPCPPDPGLYASLGGA
jgi:quercetin dioxygenase-like cupin family protein